MYILYIPTISLEKNIHNKSSKIYKNKAHNPCYICIRKEETLRASTFNARRFPYFHNP